MRFTLLAAAVVGLLCATPALATTTKTTTAPGRRLQRRDWLPWMREMVIWADCMQECMVRKVESIRQITALETDYGELWKSCLDPRPLGCGPGPSGGLVLKPSIKVDTNGYRVEIETLAGQVFRSVSSQYHRALRTHGARAAVATFFRAYIPRLERLERALYRLDHA
ncbi:MAG: hypothetical protein M1826_005533 [Phylliscum demangeonii]|nr:MAG: hypothetical protein M1826_005533 [Phylliscum demangeonii]